MKKHFNKNLVMTDEENQEFERSNICWICDKLIVIGDKKVRDHCHISGKYRDPAHYFCNLNLKITKKLPLTFHNLRGYDSHLIFKELNKFDCRISVIPNGLEKYISFTLNGNIVFIDSMLFMNSSLDKLAKYLSYEDFKYLSEESSGKKLELVKKKVIYPYEYFNSFRKFKETSSPDINKFFSSLKDCGISGKEYQRDSDVWNVFEIKTLGQYSNLHLKTNVLLLACVFEKFIYTCLTQYKLDPCYYFSSCGLNWDAMLMFTGIKLEKINNIDVHFLLEKGMKGGTSYISKICAKSDENTEITYLDMNNLYGTVMSFHYLPYGGFNFLSEKEIEGFDLISIPENSLVGYVLEVDLEYGKELHDLHNDYPLCPEK